MSRAKTAVRNGGGRSFQDASKEIQDNLKRHLERQDENQLSDSEEESGDEEHESELIERLLTRYNGIDSEVVAGVVESLKNSLHSSVCLICISSIKKTDSIYSCDSCYNSFHLQCIQRWAKDSIFILKQQLEDDPDRAEKEKAVCWTCPKCRTSKAPSQIPSQYRCYCGKERDPQFDPWVTPHSCGELCGKALAGCAHKCLLLCHPGPCPPCPVTVSTSCHCGSSRPKVRRCYSAAWGCGGRCQKVLGCGVHQCGQVCHGGECPPCEETSIQSCHCGKARGARACSSPTYKCGTPCGKLLSCGHHTCDVICHPPGECPPCPLSLERFCPCGKSSFRLSCTEATPTCGDTCGKLLSCGAHYCAERCHRGNCPSCLQLRQKRCRCGAKTKEVQCAKTFTCETKCKKVRDCGRHPCNKKCCPGLCPPCEQSCGKTLSCKNHKCMSRCHTGACYPCQHKVTVSCHCGQTKVSVPCGREKSIKPPRCKKVCTAAPDCHHSEVTQHYCHTGPCPPCKQQCNKSLPCGHSCLAACHQNVRLKVENGARPVGPWEKKGPEFTTKATPCPPCTHPVEVTCPGGHETSTWPCHSSKPAPCGRKCGRELACGNHTCQRDCHKVRQAPDLISAGINCKKCELPCQAERPKGCKHDCPLPCHLPPCPPCLINVKMKCHCGLTNIFVKCGEFLVAEDSQRETILSCKDQCPKLMACSHRCILNCHSGPCSDPSQCKKKVKISCACKSKKEEFKCNQSFGKTNLVPCDENCKAFKQVESNSKQTKQIEAEEELRNKKEAELFERQMGGGKRRKRRKTECLEEGPTLIVRNKKILIGSATFIAFISVSLLYYSLI